MDEKKRSGSDQELSMHPLQTSQHTHQSQSFDRYQKRKAFNTVRRHKADLFLFESYLAEINQPNQGLTTDPSRWKEITCEHVEAFLDWQLDKGYAIETINARLSTVKRYAGLACKMGHFPSDELARIKEVQGFRRVEGKRIDEHRPVTRIAGGKKAEPTLLPQEQLDALFAAPDLRKPQGLRDLAVLRLLYDLGVRPGELTTLVIENVDLTEGKVFLRRHKTAHEQCLLLPDETRLAIQRYLQARRDLSPQAPLLVQTTNQGKLVELVEQKDGTLLTPFWSTRNLSRRVHDLGKPLGIDLCAYDARHQWTSSVVDAGNTQQDILRAGGWTSGSKMIRRYYTSRLPANAGILRRRQQQDT